MHLRDTRVDSYFVLNAVWMGMSPGTWQNSSLWEVRVHQLLSGLFLQKLLAHGRCSSAPWERVQPGCALSELLQPWGKVGGQSILALGLITPALRASIELHPGEE